MSDDEVTELDRPYVCPGCYAVAEPCAAWCIDKALRDAREDDERSADDGDDEELNDAAWCELNVEELLPQIDALDAELQGADDYPGARSCIWCRSLIVDDFDHDFCEPDEITEKMLSPIHQYRKVLD